MTDCESETDCDICKEKSEQDEVDGINEVADSTGKLMNIKKSGSDL